MVNLNRIRGSNGSGEAAKATVTSSRAKNSSTLSVDTVINWSSEVIGTYGTPDGEGSLVKSSVRVFYGHVVGGAVEIDEFAPGYEDDGNTAGDVVLIKPTTAWADELADFLDVSHSTDGTLKLDEAMVKAINDATVPLATTRRYFGTKATFDADPARFGWLFMEKGVEYAKAAYQRLYDHLKDVDPASVVDDAAATFKFADKFFGTVDVTVDTTQTEFDTLGKKAGSLSNSIYLGDFGLSNPLSDYSISRGGSFSGQAAIFTSLPQGNIVKINSIQPSVSNNILIKF